MFSSTTNSSSGTVTTVYPFPYNFPLCSSPYNNHPPLPQENRTCGGILGLHHDQSSILNNAFMVPGPEGTIINLGGVPSNAVVSSSGDYHGQQQQCGYGNNVYRPHIVSKEVKVPEVAVKKDRHSKIFTAQGLRDRRVRLSINVAREFFDLQDLLGFDKASKTLEWLLSKSSKAIKDLEKSKCNNTNSLSSSSTSECDVVSDMNTEESEGNKKMKEAAAIDHAIRARESRAKARARARERTREKMCSTSRRSPQIFSQLSLFNELETADMNQEPGGNLLTNYQAEHHESFTVKKKLTAPSNSNYHDRILGLISKSTETGSNSCSHVNIQFPNAISQNWDINGGAFPCLSILCHYHQHES